MSFIYEAINDNTLEKEQILFLENKYNINFRRGLFCREENIFMLMKCDFSIMKDSDGENISIWILSVKGEIFEFSKNIISYKKINDETVELIQELIDFKVPEKTKINKDYILNKIYLALIEYKEVSESYSKKTKNYKLNLKINKVL